MKGFLEKQKLEIYFDAFVQNGYDDIDDIIMMSDQRVEMLMNLTGIAKKDGHKGRFLAGILLMRTMKATGLAANRIMRPSSEGSTTPHSNDGNRCKFQMCSLDITPPTSQIVFTLFFTYIFYVFFCHTYSPSFLMF